jgi:hypothetical protein
MAFDIPADLVQLQRDWFATEARWHEAAWRGDQPALDEVPVDVDHVMVAPLADICGLEHFPSLNHSGWTIDLLLCHTRPGTTTRLSGGGVRAARHR